MGILYSETFSCRHYWNMGFREVKKLLCAPRCFEASKTLTNVGGTTTWHCKLGELKSLQMQVATVGERDKEISFLYLGCYGNCILHKGLDISKLTLMSICNSCPLMIPLLLNVLWREGLLAQYILLQFSLSFIHWSDCLMSSYGSVSGFSLVHCW
jgi:hypothetical protein